MRDNVKRYLNVKISFGTSDICTDLGILSQYYKQACRNLEYANFHRDEMFIAETEAKKVISLNIQDEKELENAIKERDEQLLIYRLDHIFRELIDKRYPRSELQMIFTELINIITKTIRNNDINSLQIFSDEVEPYSILSTYDTILDIYKWFMNIFLKVIRCLDSLDNKNKTKNYSSYTEKAIKYMRDNFSSKISLQDIANCLNINSSYLSRIFKDETGINIVSYLNNLRMQAAVKLIDRGELNLKGVAEKIGIHNYNHFINLFKAFYGITPMEYQKSAKKQFINNLL
jgi:two-component system response regulator YesN